jgi:hypothetical protein
VGLLAMKLTRSSLLLFTLMIVSALVAQPGHADPIPERGDVPPAFIQRPSGADFIQFYPPAALAQSVVGGALLDCTVGLDTVVSCSILNQYPTGWGFGDAALAVSRAFRASPRMIDGRPVAGGRIRIPLRFTMTQEREAVDPAYPVELRDYLERNPWPDLPRWSDTPNSETVDAYYPVASKRAGERGRGVLSCRVKTDRTLACTISDERPANRGFGAAALSLSTKFIVYEDDTSFIERHRVAPFKLPINFGASPLSEPVSTTFNETLPFAMPPPPPDLMALIYPPRAQFANISGLAVVLCTVQPAPPAKCEIKSEDPPGWQFGDAALSAILMLPLGSGDEGFLAGDQIIFHMPFNRGTAAQ